jgi:hypothetical protein
MGNRDTSQVNSQFPQINFHVDLFLLMIAYAVQFDNEFVTYKIRKFRKYRLIE